MQKIHYLLVLLLSLLSIHTSFATQIYGHRGARALSPENSIPAYQTAMGIGVDYVDMDINMSKDGVLVVYHNFALDPDYTRNAKGQWITNKNLLIKDLTVKQLKTYDIGKIKPGTAYAKLFKTQWPVAHTRIPTLKEVIDYVKQHAGNHVGFQIEIKTDPTHPNWTYSPSVLAKALDNIMRQEHIVNRTEVQAFDWRCLIDLQKIDPRARTAYLTEFDSKKQFLSADPKKAGLWTGGHLLKQYGNSIPNMIKALGGSLWDPQDVELNQQLIAKSHKLGLKVVAWTWPEQTGKVINIPLSEKLISWHIDGLITGRPDILRGLLAARGEKLPKPRVLIGTFKPLTKQTE